MKFKTLMAMSLACCFFASTGFAQTCGSPTTITSGQTIDNIGGNPTTCGGDGSFTDICGGATLTGASNVYSWTNNGGPASGSITVTPTAPSTYDTAIAIVGPAVTCAGAVGTCVSTSDSAQAGGAETVSLSGATNGTYYLVISSFSTTAANQCGPYGMTIGTLPVKLQNFSVN